MPSSVLPAFPALSESELGQLRWRCRRGMLENDLLLARFFKCHGQALTVPLAKGLTLLMDLADNELLDLFLGRQLPKAALDCPEVHRVLALVQAK